MSKSILAALQQLDSSNDNHWTADGMPRLDTIKVLTGEEVTRAQVTEAAPYFNRTNPTTEVPPEVLDPPAPAGADATTADAPPITTEEKDEEPVEAAAPLVVTVNDEEVGELQGALTATREAMVEAEAAITAAKDTYQKLVNQEVELDDKLGELVGVETSGDAIRGYLASQKKLVADKVNRFKQMKDAGLGEVLNNLGKMRAPIDEAMARKRARGGKRPARALKK